MGRALGIGATLAGIAVIGALIYYFRNNIISGAGAVGSTIGGVIGNLFGSVPQGFISNFDTSTQAAGNALGMFFNNLVSGTILQPQSAFATTPIMAGQMPAPQSDNFNPSQSNILTSAPTSKTISATAFAAMPPAAPVMNLKQGALTVAAYGSPSDILSQGITIRGNMLSPYLQSKTNVAVGIVSDNVVGTREIAGTPQLFERLAQNLGR